MEIAYSTNEPTRRVRVRYAPGLTGQMTLQGLRTALYNYLFAKQHGGDFILRIEDIDKELDGSADDIIKVLQWTGLEWNEGPGGANLTNKGPYVQS